ncbi:hypothetical protein R1sor_021663 [Riccia sorocarpa]|uniref:Uncharacterized protein n=1 Tax=Riccia sorocarpa TaxID=122646 RepID=A0ABD3GHN7_9MARC
MGTISASRPKSNLIQARPCRLISTVERKSGETKWRKVFRPSFLACTGIFIGFVFFCNLVVNEPYTYTGPWNVSALMDSIKPAAYSNCTCAPPEDSDRRNRSQVQCPKPAKRPGTETLPQGIVEATTDLELRHLWKRKAKEPVGPQNLLAMAVGLKQKKTVDKIIQKFPAENFTFMLFHYDGKVDGWMDLKWGPQAIHVIAANQTKWWFAKRFLHPDVVAKYNYIFLWDEDLGVEHFHVNRYLGIMQDEGLEISQPALDSKLSEVHHRLTVRQPKVRVHKRLMTGAGSVKSCDNSSTGPPCTGWVEMMAPVFSRAAWRCTWHLIQNDLVHAWGLDFKLGYCAQGVRSEKVGIIDSEYIIHEGIPSLGGESKDKTAKTDSGNSTTLLEGSTTDSEAVDERTEIRLRSKAELHDFSRRWKRAAGSDPDWRDPYEVTIPPEDDHDATGNRVRRR